MPNPWFRLYTEFAIDPKVQAMTPAYQRHLIMLFCLHCSNGIETLHETEIETYLRVTETELKKIKSVFIEKGFIDDTWKILNWDKRQFISDASTERVRKYREAKRNNVKRCGNVTVTAPDTDTDTDTDINNKENKGASQKIPNEAIDLASLLFSLHASLDNKYKVPAAQLASWARDIEKLNRIDGRDWPDIEAAIRWVKTPGQFWAPNIMSGKKLREKFPTLVAQMGRGEGAPKVATRTSFLDMGA